MLQLTASRCRNSAELGDAVPESSRSAELRNRRELLVRGGVPKIDQSGRVVDADAGVREGAEILRANGH